MAVEDGRTQFSPEYARTFGELVAWGDEIRTSEPRINAKPINRRFDREIIDHTAKQLFHYVPTVNGALESAKVNGEIVFSDIPLIEGFPQSPYARMHVGLQHVRRALMGEALLRGENLRNVPPEIGINLPVAASQLDRLPQPAVPQIDPEVLHYLSQLPENNRFAYDQFIDGLENMHELLVQTLAVKLKFAQGSPVLGYNKRAVQLSNLMLNALDAAASCSPWQMEWDKDSYYQRLVDASRAYITDRLKLWEHLQDGKMWSVEMANDPVVKGMTHALKNGFSEERVDNLFS